MTNEQRLILRDKMRFNLAAASAYAEEAGDSTNRVLIESLAPSIDGAGRS